MWIAANECLLLLFFSWRGTYNKRLNAARSAIKLNKVTMMSGLCDLLIVLFQIAI